MERITTISGLEISFEQVEYEESSFAGDHLNIKVELSADGFSGHADFWAVKADFDNFIKRLKEFDKTLSGDVRGYYGWGDTIYYGMEFIAYDKQGHVGVRLILSNDSVCSRVKCVDSKTVFQGPVVTEIKIKEDARNYLIIEKNIEPGEINKFIHVFEKMAIK